MCHTVYASQYVFYEGLDHDIKCEAMRNIGGIVRLCNGKMQYFTLAKENE